jgi:hypothetical protein
MLRKSFAAALVVGALFPATARADGLPVPVDDAGPSGVATVNGSARVVTVYAGGRTVVERIALPDGSIAAQSILHGRYTIPVVALDGTAGGISHDGSTLAVIKPRVGFPRARTELVVYDARQLRIRRHVDLRGDFSYDAFSPDGSTLYLVQYTDPGDPNSYLVRALDTSSGRLAPDPIVDPHEEPDEMRGLPMTRETSADGRWSYTLYDGAGKAPFIHALDTSAPRAVCIDLPKSLAKIDLYRLKLRLAGDRLSVVGPDGPLAVVDTRTFKVGAPTAAPSRNTVSAPARDDGGVPLAAILLPAALALIVVGAIARSATRPRPRSTA